MTEIKYLNDAIQYEIGTELRCCNSTVAVMDKGYGLVLLKHDPPMYDCKLWAWSYTGGTSCDDKPFSAEIERTKQFWDQRIAMMDSNNKIIVVKGQMYSIGPKETNKSWAGFGGDRFVMRDLKTGAVGFSCNLSHMGKVPEEYNCADTHEFLDRKTEAVEVFGKDGLMLNDSQHHSATH